MKRKLSALCILGLSVIALPFSAASAGVDDIVKKCDNCHGSDGNSEHGEVPNIAGMSKVYIHDAMMAFKAGDRPGVKYKPENGDETDMNAIAEKLSEDDINALGAHYAGKKFKIHKQEADAAAVAEGKRWFDRACEKCHSERGTVADDDSGLLLGQWKPYLKKQFEMFESGKRDMPKKMAKRFKRVKDGAKAAILEYLVSGNP